MSQALPPSLSLRQSDKGGELSDAPTANPENVLNLTWHLVLLIHGYNNDLQAGREAYEGFREVQRRLAGLEEHQQITDGQLVDIYWPGDANWGIASPLYYPWSIAKAKEAAAVLAESLKRAVAENGFKQIEIIAHSMGGRLTFELIKHLVLEVGVRVRRVVFMAAAFPTFMLDPDDGNQLRAAYDAKVQEGSTSLFSPDDMVLALAFPLGQTIAGSGEGWFPTALGHNVWKSHLTPTNLAQHQIHGAGHSDYWGWNKETLDQAEEANQYVRAFLQFNPPGSRDIASRQVAVRQGPEERV
jgi:pimeloyl-ACP methyl ester carboxylesterase